MNLSIAENIKAIREEKGLKQIEVACHIGVDKSAYSKIEKGTRAVTIEELYKMAQLFNTSTDQIIDYDGGVPKEVILEDKSLTEQMQLVQQLDEEDKQTVLKIIQKMLSNKKFKEFFNKNVATLSLLIALFLGYIVFQRMDDIQRIAYDKIEILFGNQNELILKDFTKTALLFHGSLTPEERETYITINLTQGHGFPIGFKKSTLYKKLIQEELIYIRELDTEKRYLLIDGTRKGVIYQSILMFNS